MDAATGACLGLVGGDVWTRAGVNPTPHRKRPLEERESARWIDTAQRAKPVLRSAASLPLRRRGVTVVDDREADIYPKWAVLPEADFHLLTRAMSDRLLVGGGTLFNVAAQLPVAGRRTIDLPARPPVRARRSAMLELRFGEVEICRPRDEPDRSLPRTVRLRLVEVQEVGTPEGAEPLPPAFAGAKLGGC